MSMDYTLLYNKHTMNLRFYACTLAGALLISTNALSAPTNDSDTILVQSKAKERTLGTAIVVASTTKRIHQSAYNAVAIDTKKLQNSTKTIADALTKAPGIKLRETGGVGSEQQLMIDGFSGKHVKVFIDGVPQEGVGSAFSLGNIPAGFADRIEIYKGVVPVEFGTDALGGVVNIITGKQPRGWNLDASYSYGSFNTHRTHVNFSHSLKSGFTYELTAFQNFSDNDYKVDVPVEDFTTGRIDRKKLERVRRFHDNYHNEAITGKVGWVGKTWADRFMIGLGYAQEYKEIQTGVRQETVFGDKHRRSHSLMPSVEWRKHNLLVKGLSAAFTANYNRNEQTNIDTAQVKYNWRGETKPLNSPGEQSYQHSRSDNENWNTTLRMEYRIGKQHTLTFNHVFNTFQRTNTSLLAKIEQKDAIDRRSAKNIAGLSYRWTPTKAWNATVFGKFYGIRVEGPVATDANASSFVKNERSQQNWGYGAAATYFLPLRGMQLKASYEKALRLPTINEMFGDEDLEQGSIAIRPEQSHNINAAVNYQTQIGKHNVFAEAGFIFRDTRDYIQRNITDLSGGKQAASYVNYGKVLTKGFNLALRYQYDDLASVGGHFTQMNTRDNMPTMIGTNVANLLYKDRMPNLPYCFADFDAIVHWNDFLAQGNRLSLGYDAQYTHSFTYYAARIGANNNDFLVPNQWSHNLSLTFSLQNGRYNLSLECKNLADARLYDNFSLQKPGRSFMAKLRLNLHGRN